MKAFPRSEILEWKGFKRLTKQILQRKQHYSDVNNFFRKIHSQADNGWKKRKVMHKMFMAQPNAWPTFPLSMLLCRKFPMVNLLQMEIKTLTSDPYNKASNSQEVRFIPKS